MASIAMPKVDCNYRLFAYAESSLSIPSQIFGMTTDLALGLNMGGS